MNEVSQWAQRPNRRWLIILYGTFLVLPLFAQRSMPEAGHRHSVGIGTGYDHALLALSVRYAALFPRQRLAAIGTFTQSTALLGSGNYGLRAGVQKWLAPTASIVLSGTGEVSYVGANNVAGTYRSLGFRLGASVLYASRRSWIGPEVSLSSQIATKVGHSDYAREFLYAGAADGWYANTANILRIGGTYLRRFGRRWDAAVAGGYQGSGRFDGLLPGLYFNIHCNRYF